MNYPQGYALVSGDDEYLADREAESWFRGLCAQMGPDCETEVIDGRAPTIAEVQDCLCRIMRNSQNLSLFGERRILWLRHASFLSDQQAGKFEGSKEGVEDFRSWLETFDDPNTYVLISGYPLDRRKAFCKFFEKNGRLHFLASSKNTDQLVQLVLQECRTHDVRISREAAETLISRVNGNTRMMMSEIEKMATFLASESRNEITYERILEHVPAFGESDFFELADAFYASDLDEALQALRRHFFTHKDGRPVLSNLQTRNRLLLQLRALKEGQQLDISSRSLQAPALQKAASHYTDCFQDLSAKSEFHPFGQNAWYLGKLATIANQITLKTLIRFQLLFIEAFSRLIDHPNEQEDVVRDLLIACHLERRQQS
jgi:DNA polymerase-3 subunit delta